MPVMSLLRTLSIQTICPTVRVVMRAYDIQGANAFQKFYGAISHWLARLVLGSLQPVSISSPDHNLKPKPSRSFQLSEWSTLKQPCGALGNSLCGSNACDLWSTITHTFQTENLKPADVMLHGNFSDAYGANTENSFYSNCPRTSKFHTE